MSEAHLAHAAGVIEISKGDIGSYAMEAGGTASGCSES